MRAGRPYADVQSSMRHQAGCGTSLGSLGSLTNFERIRICRGGTRRLYEKLSTNLLLVIGLPMIAPVELCSSMLLDKVEATANSSSSPLPTKKFRKLIGNKDKDYCRQA